MKKLLAFILSAMLLAGLLLSCGGGGDTAVDAAVTTTAAKVTTEAAETEFDPMATLTKLDGNGYEFSVLGYGGSTASYREAEYFRAIELNGEVINDALYYRNSDVEELYNVKITYNLEFKDTDSRKTFESLMLAGDDTYDLFGNKEGYVFAFCVAKGLAADFAKVPHIDISQPWYAQDAIREHTIKKTMYGLFGDMLSTNTTCCWSFLFNKKLITDYKLENPYDVVRSDRWTIEYLSDTTKEIASDLDGDGVWTEADFYGLGADKWATLDAWQVSLDIYGLTINDDGIPELSFFSERTVKAVDAVFNLYYNNVGTLVNKITPYDCVNTFAEDRCIYFPIFIDYMLGDTLRAMETDYGVIPYPKLDEAQESYSTYVHPRYGVIMLPVTVTEDRYEIVGAVTDALGATSYKYVRPAIYDTALKVKTVRDEDSAEMLDLLIETRHYDLSTAFEQYSAFPFTPAKCFRNNLNSGVEFKVASWYESQESAAQAALDEFLDSIPD